MADLTVSSAVDTFMQAANASAMRDALGATAGVLPANVVNLAVPGAVGGTTPAAGSFTTIVGTTFNGNTFTTGTGVLTIAAAKTLTVSNTLTLAGTDGSTLNIGAGGTLSGLALTTANSSPGFAGDIWLDSSAVDRSLVFNFGGGASGGMFPQAANGKIVITSTLQITLTCSEAGAAYQIGSAAAGQLNQYLYLHSNGAATAGLTTTSSIPEWWQTTYWNGSVAVAKLTGFTATTDTSNNTTLTLSTDAATTRLAVPSGTGEATYTFAGDTDTGLGNRAAGHIMFITNGIERGYVDNSGKLVLFYGLTLVDSNVALSTGTGTKMGTAANQKYGEWGVTPVIQPAGALQAAITNSTGGTQNGTLVDVATTGIADPAKINDNFTDVFALLDAIRTALVSTGRMKGAA